MFSLGDAASGPEPARSFIKAADLGTGTFINGPLQSARSGERPEGAKPSAREPTAGGNASRGEAGEA
ncbi:hypothetical protein [Halorubrum vacuolatum]|uniref:hypothetical protein n=1 Tax=Halorubrum vacuolatum TaxID=63740 RepID=UPI00117B027C|nr:hypothetical protein [Halorubrum vacuolatum]